MAQKCSSNNIDQLEEGASAIASAFARIKIDVQEIIAQNAHGSEWFRKKNSLDTRSVQSSSSLTVLYSNFSYFQ